MSAAAQVLGRYPDGTVRRYGLQTQPDKLLHVLATQTGKLAYCGYLARVAIPVSIERARAIEGRIDASAKGFSWCQTCLSFLTPQPDPGQWRRVPKGRETSP